MDDEKDMLSGLTTELNRGTLVLSVLSLMGDAKYGYALVQRLADSGIETDPNTLYPLLRRLEKQGLLQSQWETDGPKPRKYYMRTPEGDRVYSELRTQWRRIAAGMELLLNESEGK